MKYQNSRKRIATEFTNLINNSFMDRSWKETFRGEVDDLLSTLPEKECKKINLENVTGIPLNTPIMFIKKNGRIGYGKVKPSPSLDGLEMEEINMATYQGNRDTAIEIMVENKLNELIRNQNAIIKKLKSL